MQNATAPRQRSDGGGSLYTEALQFAAPLMELRRPADLNSTLLLEQLR